MPVNDYENAPINVKFNLPNSIMSHYCLKPGEINWKTQIVWRGEQKARLNDLAYEQISRGRKLSPG